MPLNESMRAHNREVMAKIARKQVYPLVRKEALAILDELGMFVKSWIASKTYTYEDQTYNLTDSTGCAIYENGKLVKFMPYMNQKQASGPRTSPTTEQDSLWMEGHFSGQHSAATQDALSDGTEPSRWQ